MKLNYEELQSKPRILRSLTSLTVKEFEALLVSFSRAWESFVSVTFQREGRQRAYGGGRKPNLKELEDKLLFYSGVFSAVPDAGGAGVFIWDESSPSE